MRLLAPLILFGSLVLTTPIALESSARLIKRGLKVNEETGKVTDTHSNQVVGSVNQQMIDTLVKSKKAILAKFHKLYTLA